VGRDVERRLRERLARVEALHAGATTPGERAAAQKALERVVAQLGEVMASDEVRRFVRAHVASLGVAEPRHVRRSRGMPSTPELLRTLARWERGDWTRAELHRWASHIVDAVVLPHDPAHEGACRAEVLLQLSSRDLGHLHTSDLPRIRSFLSDRDWAAWFALLAEAARRRAA